MGWIQKNLVNCTDPRKHGKGLVANRSREWQYRIGDYRLIANINDETVAILMLKIGQEKIFINKDSVFHIMNCNQISPLTLLL